jgi:hypothetical protein
MTLREVTRTVLKLVEDASGCPVVVNEDRSVMTLAASRIARGSNRIHSISFNPSTVREPDYLICYQCGFISLRVGKYDYSLKVENLPSAPPPKGQMELIAEDGDGAT